AESQRYFEQAAELADEPSDQAALFVLAGQMARHANVFERARSLFDRAHEIFESLGDAGSAARVSARLGEIDHLEGHPHAAAARLRPALETLSTEEPGEDVAIVAGQLGRFLILGGHLDEAAPYVEQSLALAEALGLPDAFAQALNNKGISLLRRDRLRE